MCLYVMYESYLFSILNEGGATLIFEVELMKIERKPEL